jgi:cytochrome P450
METGANAEEPDFDVDVAALGEGFIRDPYPVYERLRQRGPVHRARLAEGTVVWLVVGYDEVRAVLADSRLSKAWHNVSPDHLVQPVVLGENMLRADAPQHTRLRRLVSQAFTPRRVASLAPRTQQITEQLLEAMHRTESRRADLVEALSFPLPITVICELLGVPFLERDAFRAWSEVMLVGALTPRTRQATAEMGAYLRELVDTKRRAPGDDMFSDLIAVSDEDGDRLSEDELLGMAQILLIAGFETTVNLISNGVLALLTHPEQCAKLRATPSLMAGAVEEMLRYEGPVETATFRFTLDPIEIGGTLIPGGGEIVLPVLADADRDPRRFDAPERFDITRDARDHMAFGHGSHYCLGAPLARLETRIAISTLLDTFPVLELDVHPGALVWRHGALLRGPRSLPVRWR